MKKVKRTLVILAVSTFISTPILSENLKKLSINDASFANPWIQTDSTVKMRAKNKFPFIFQMMQSMARFYPDKSCTKDQDSNRNLLTGGLQ